MSNADKWVRSVIVDLPIQGEPSYTHDGIFTRFKAHENQFKYVVRHVDTGIIIAAENAAKRDTIYNDLTHNDELSDKVLRRTIKQMEEILNSKKRDDK